MKAPDLVSEWWLSSRLRMPRDVFVEEPGPLSHLEWEKANDLFSGYWQSDKVIDAVLPVLTQLAEAKAVLQEVEWSVESDDRGALCPQCGGSRDIAFYHSSKDRAPIRGHAPDCRLAKVLEAR